MDTTIPRPPRSSSPTPPNLAPHRRHPHHIRRPHQIHDSARLQVHHPPLNSLYRTINKHLIHSYVATYLLSGHRYTHDSTSILLYRLLLPPPSPPTDLSSTRINLSETRPLDPQGAYILQAAVRVQDGSKLETMSKGVNELLGLKETLKGCVELEMGDRLALDTRMR